VGTLVSMPTSPYAPTPDRPGRILVVDDLPGNRRLLQQELRNEPFIITLAGCAEEALQAAREQVFEGILMDVHLPGTDGIEACRVLREDSLNRRTPLIFITAVRFGGDWVTAGLEAGGNDYLYKPYALPELLAKLRMMVRLSRQDAAALEGERHRTLLEVAGGLAHELSQPLATAQLLLDQLLKHPDRSGPRQLAELRDCLSLTSDLLHQVQNLHTYITKPYAHGRILDLKASSGPAQDPS
jgi:two-component system, sensor histidine kinase and response regulator